MEREFQIHRTEHDYSLAEFWRWTLALLIGIIMGILGFLVDWGIEKLNNFKFDSTVNSIRTSGELSDEHLAESDLASETYFILCNSAALPSVLLSEREKLGEDCRIY